MSRISNKSGCLFQSLPAPVKRRLKALKKLQFEATKVEAKFYEEIHELECKYHELYTPIYNQRAKISKGKYIYTYTLSSASGSSPRGIFEIADLVTPSLPFPSSCVNHAWLASFFLLSQRNLGPIIILP
jgi:hypothetical protein